MLILKRLVAGAFSRDLPARIYADSAFRTYGLPFTLYRDGGFIQEWTWLPSALVWHRMVADAAVIAAGVLLLGRAWQTVRARRLNAKHR